MNRAENEGTAPPSAHAAAGRRRRRIAGVTKRGLAARAALAALLAVGLTVPALSASATTTAGAAATAASTSTGTLTTEAPPAVPAPHSTSAEHQYTPTPDAEFANPERGFNKVINDFIDVKPFQLKAEIERGNSFVHAGVDLSPYLTSDLDQAFLDKLDTSFALLREHGLKAFMHFSYSQNLDPKTPGLTTSCPDVSVVPKGVPADADADLEWILKHLASLKPVLAKNTDVIMGLDAGFIGEWGEWHCSPHLLLEPETKKKVLDAILDAFPAERQVAIRHPYDIIDPTLVPDWTSADSRVTDYQSCYASRYPDDDGTWVEGVDTGEATNEEIVALKAKIGELGENHMIGGVACKPSVRTSCAVAVTGPTPEEQAEPAVPNLYDSAPELAKMHFTYLDGFFDPDALDQYAPCRHEMMMKLGYRLELRHASLPATLVPGERTPISITLGNVGWASIINERPAFLVLRGDDHTYQLPLAADPRSWKSGQEATIEQEIEIPAELAPGHYTLALWLPDKYESLRGNPAYSVRFANENVWDEKAGDNVLAQVEVPAKEVKPALAATGVGTVLPLAWSLAGGAGAVSIVGMALLLRLRRRRV